MADRELGMRSEVVLRRIALGCAVFMLFGPLAGRTTWAKVNGSGATTDAAAYNAVAIVTGVVAFAALAAALHTRPRIVVPVLAVLAAIAAFGLSVYVCALYVWARWQGEIWLYGASSFAEDPGPKYMAHLPWGPPYFALAATVGALASLGLAVTWLWHSRGEPGNAFGSEDACLSTESCDVVGRNPGDGDGRSCGVCRY